MPMSPLLLAPDTAALFRPGVLDPHGWRRAGEGPQPYYDGPANLQLQPGVSDPRAAAGGGHGPHGPARDLTGNLFLPADDAEPLEGSSAVIRGRVFVLSQVRLVADPTDSGLDCYTATVVSTDTWPDGGERNG
jgi:hypothetical protein